jgi:hypothetical protein
MKRIWSAATTIFFPSVLFLICASTNTAHAQAVNATLSGRVTDSSSGSVANANVTAVSTTTGFTRTVQTLDSGNFTIPALPAGQYNVTVTFTGFAKQTKTIVLQVGQTADLDFVLTPGNIEEKVEVASPKGKSSIFR